MSVLRKVLLTTVLLTTVVGVVMASLSDVPTADEGQPTMRDVLTRGKHQKFLTLLKDSGQESLLLRTDVTLLVPSEETLASLGDARLKKLAADGEAMKEFIDNHLLHGRYTVTDMVTKGELTTAGGDPLEVRQLEDGVECGGLPMMTTDLLCRSAIIHVLDGAFLPASHAPEESDDLEIIDEGPGRPDLELEIEQ